MGWDGSEGWVGDGSFNGSSMTTWRVPRFDGGRRLGRSLRGRTGRWVGNAPPSRSFSDSSRGGRRSRLHRSGDARLCADARGHAGLLGAPHRAHGAGADRRRRRRAAGAAGLLVGGVLPIGIRRSSERQVILPAPVEQEATGCERRIDRAVPRALMLGRLRPGPTWRFEIGPAHASPPTDRRGARANSLDLGGIRGSRFRATAHSRAIPASSGAAVRGSGRQTTRKPTAVMSAEGVAGSRLKRANEAMN